MNKRSSKESRENIIKSAFQVFSTYGYEGTTMRLIAQHAGISVGGIYLYFKNKDELCLFLIKEKLHEFSSMIEAYIKSLDNPIDALMAYITMSIEYAKKNKEFIISQSKQRGFTFGIEVKRDFFKGQKALIMEMIKNGIDRGFFVEYNPEEVTKVIMGLIRGFVLSVVVDHDNLYDPNEACRIILHGLLKRDKV